MSINVDAYQHRTVDAAIKKAHVIIDDFIEHGTYVGERDDARKVISGWALASLAENIASAILAAAGFDLDGLEEELNEAELCEVGDILARYHDVDLSPEPKR